MKVSPNESQERKGEGKRKGARMVLACDELVEGKDREENKIESKARGWERGTRREPACRVAFHQSQMLFSSFRAPALFWSRDVSPRPTTLYSVPLSSVLVVRASWCPPVSPYTPHSSSLLSSLRLLPTPASHPLDHPLTPNRPSSLYVLPASLSLLSFLLSFLLGCFHIDK